MSVKRRSRLCRDEILKFSLSRLNRLAVADEGVLYAAE